MIDLYDLENMIFNIESRKNLKKVEFSQKALIEVLSYLKELSNKVKEIENLTAKCEKYKQAIEKDKIEFAIEELEEFMCWLENNTAWGEPLDYNKTHYELERQIMVLKEK